MKTSTKHSPIKCIIYGRIITKQKIFYKIAGLYGLQYSFMTNNQVYRPFLAPESLSTRDERGNNKEYRNTRQNNQHDNESDDSRRQNRREREERFLYELDGHGVWKDVLIVVYDISCHGRQTGQDQTVVLACFLLLTLHSNRALTDGLTDSRYITEQVDIHRLASITQ